MGFVKKLTRAYLFNSISRIMGKYKTIILKTENNVAYVSFNRPEVKNAFNNILIKELNEIFTKLRDQKDLRAIVLTGKGDAFCAGADLNWMKDVLKFSYEENLAESLLLSDLFYNIYSHDLPVIARVNGPAIGGGTGMAAVCDIVIASEKAIFSLSEVKLGLVPACISPYVIKRVGEANARECFITGRRLKAADAKAIGLVNEVASENDLDKAVQKRIDKIITSGPEAIKMCKDLCDKVPQMSVDEFKKYTAEVIAKMRMGEEGQEGMKAFLEKRKPKWVKNK